MPAQPFAILDFPGQPARLFTRPREIFEARQISEVRPVLDAAGEAARRGLTAIGFVAYEAAPAFDAAFVVHDPTPLPLAWFALFEHEKPYDDENRPGGPVLWQADVERTEYEAAVANILDGIANGDHYQVNYSFRLRAADVNPLSLWHRLRASQRGAYSAYIDVGGHVIVSASPELFIQRHGNRVVTRPMKGTSPRGRWDTEDDARAAALAASAKERAENLMIVDLLRNDLGRVAATGSVRVTQLCEVERWPTVLQMTSTIEGLVPPDLPTAALFAALFPCGSVTGAPKIAAMKAIKRLESSPRGVYCGAVGYMGPGNDATFNVAIRTAWVQRDGRAEYGVGGGITWDSRADAEHGEALLKARVLAADNAPSGFELLETMRMEGGSYKRLELHLARLAGSARYFGFQDPVPAARQALAASVREGHWRVRLVANAQGAVSASVAPMPQPLAESPLVEISRTPVDSTDVLLFHKTTRRAAYDERRSAYPHAFDVLLWNERGEMTEFTIGNVVLEIDGERLTPRRESGLLAGVFREEILRSGVVRETTLDGEDLRRASRIWLVNSLREWVQVRLAPSPVRGFLNER